MIRVFDAYGREALVPREVWRDKILPDTIRAQWNNPEMLYSVIFNALTDGFRSEVMAAAEQLYKIDSVPSRGTCVWAIVLKEEGRLDDAEKVLRDFIAKHGEDGSVLTNLAKVYAQRQDHLKAEQILWHGLEIEPNQDNGLVWYVAIHREREGETGEQAALNRVAALPRSWRAQLWLARAALKAKNLDAALVYYNQSLSRVEKPAPTDMLKQISGDLGNAGHLPELLRLVEPQYSPQIHGLTVGNNLIKALIDLGQLDSASRILNQLFALNRPDWQKALSFWENELSNARIAVANAGADKRKKMSILTIDGPVWLDPSAPVIELFGGKPDEGIHICFFGCSAELATNMRSTRIQQADLPGRLSRGLPLFFAEQVGLKSRSSAKTLVPWIAEKSGGFILFGAPPDDSNASNYARQADSKNDYVVVSHLKTQAEPWTVELRLIRTIDGKCLGNLSRSFPSAKPEESIPELTRELLDLLVKEADVDLKPTPVNYVVPGGANFPLYLLRLEQLLAVRCGSMEGVQKEFLNSPREIVDGSIQQCLVCPVNVNVRVLLARILLAMKKVRPDILPEFREKISLLQKEKPLTERAQSLIQRMLDEAMNGATISPS